MRKSLDEDQLPGKFFFAITPSTLTGLKISLGATLELIDFLHNECNYDYLMTILLTQDALEVNILYLMFDFLFSFDPRFFFVFFQ